MTVSAASFLIVPEMVARSDRVALVPARLIHPDDGRLARHAPPLPVDGFAIGLVWHDRTTASPLHRWLREKAAEVT